MDSVITLFKFIDYPVWIKDDKDEIIFMNDNFKHNFIKSDKEIKREETLRIIKKLDQGSKEIVIIRERYYKPVITQSYDMKNIIGILIDITDDIQSLDLDIEKNVLKTILDDMPEMIFYKDKNLRYKGMNNQFKTFYENIGVENMIGKCDWDLPIDNSFARKYGEWDKIVLKKKESLHMEETVDGNTFETIKKPILDSKGEANGILGVVKNITGCKEIKQMTNKLCYTDALTNLFNRTYFDEKINELISDKKYPIGVILGDVNELKIVNDTLGHGEGDKLLKKMSQILMECCIKDETVFRWGGDEFIILLPNCTDLQCTSLMKEIDNKCNKNKCGDISLKVSQGYAILKEGGTIDKALAEVEDKVYKQKILSENTVRVSILDNLRANLENKNIETEQHTDRVANYCVEISKALKLDEYTIEKAALVGKMHDIGKIGISDHILLKPGKLTKEEYEDMKTHSEKGYRLASLIPEVSHISREILTHHERWDGKGYPLGLQKEEIPILSRVVCVADSFDAMIEDRCYSKGRSIIEAVTEIKRCSGTQFDPNIVDVFINIIDKIKELSI